MPFHQFIVCTLSNKSKRSHVYAASDRSHNSILKHKKRGPIVKPDLFYFNTRKGKLHECHKTNHINGDGAETGSTFKRGIRSFGAMVYLAGRTLISRAVVIQTTLRRSLLSRVPLGERLFPSIVIDSPASYAS